MPFRVRESLLGKAILQASDGDHWRDAYPGELLKKGFSITEPGSLTKLYERIDHLETRLIDYAAAVENSRRQHKRLPVLTETV